MLRMFVKRFICFFVSVFILMWQSCICFATIALPGEVSDSGVLTDAADAVIDLFTAAREWLQEDLYHTLPSYGNKLRSFFDESICGLNPTAQGRHNLVKQNTIIDGKQGYYYVCEYCGKSAGEITQEAENEYVASLPAQEITSDGGLIWHLTLEDVSGRELHFANSSSSNFSSYGVVVYPQTSATGINGNFIRVFDNRSFAVVSNRSGYDKVCYRVEIVKSSYPCDGIFVYYTNEFGTLKRNQVDSSVNYFYIYEYADLTENVRSANFKLPDIYVTPLFSFDVHSANVSDTYNINTRAASISGDYGIITQSGDIQKIDSQTIVNETNNTYYSPSTGEPVEFSDWSYDYSDRSYTLTTTEGDTTTVTYGDEYVTIQEGDTVYNVYYITNNSSSDSEGGDSGGGETPPAHMHNYTSDITTAPTCTLPGVRTFNCSCGASYTQQIAPTGHTWEVKNHVNTEYDSEGELLQQGYTVYRCSVCGEEYRSPDDSLPPGLVETDNQLAEVSNQVQAWYNSLRELYQGYIGFLTDAFRFLPDELVTLIEFGIGSSFVIAVSKKLLR